MILNDCWLIWDILRKIHIFLKFLLKESFTFMVACYHYDTFDLLRLHGRVWAIMSLPADPPGGWQVLRSAEGNEVVRIVQTLKIPSPNDRPDPGIQRQRQRSGEQPKVRERGRGDNARRHRQRTHPLFCDQIHEAKTTTGSAQLRRSIPAHLQGKLLSGTYSVCFRDKFGSVELTSSYAPNRNALSACRAHCLDNHRVASYFKLAMDYC
jgi:hypothetical protein